MTLPPTDDWARVSTPARHYFSKYITTTDWLQDFVQHTALGLSSQLVGNCQTLNYI